MESHQLLRAEIAIEGKIFRQKADAFFGPYIPGPVAENADTPLVSVDEPHQDTHAGCLARAVWPQEGTNFSWSHFKRHIGKGRYPDPGKTPLVDLGHVGEFNGWRRHRRLLPPAFFV